MTLARTLHPEDHVAHYRVVGPLGAGGMGEVYLAQDQTLERNVALKVLPPELVRNEDRVRRFVQEAKSASSLNHPNIVTIYEIGQDEVLSSSGEASTGSVQYISMELVTGKTLGAKIHEEKSDLRTLLGYLAQAAEGISKAHAAGIVHRDLKPGNIMVSDDGFAKVLDFGLAKLTEQRSGEASATAMTEVADKTAEGAVMGTVYYMSPEQVQGKSVDHRSDVFSFGCLLYEAATRQRPFAADSNVETMHKILHDKPRPIEEINPDVPTELRRLIRRCLNKVPDQRLQSMKDLALELREIVDEYDTLSASATSASGSGSVVGVPSVRRSRVLPLVIAAGVIAVAAVGWWGLRRGGDEYATQPFETMHVTPHTSLGNVTDCAISPDGRYLAYVSGQSGQFGLHVRQVATGSNVEVIPTQEGTIEWVSFTPDGNYLFYLKRKPEAPSYRTLMSIPSLGGVEQERAFDVDSRPAFSPDGKQICFYRGIPQQSMGKLFILDLDTGKQRELATIASPDVFPSSPVWLPDGKSIAGLVNRGLPTLRSIVVLFDAETGSRKEVFTKESAFYRSLAWLQDGGGVVVTGTDLSAGVNDQVFLITHPGRQLKRVTNDFNSYNAVTTAGNEAAIAAVRTSQMSNLFVVDIDDGAIRTITRSTSPENSPFGSTTAGDNVIYTGVRNRFISGWMVSAEGGDARPISGGEGHMLNLRAAAGRIVYSRLDSGKFMHIWRANTDGSGIRQVTNGTGETTIDISPDGKLATFTYNDSTNGVWLAPLDGGDARLLSAAALSGTGFFSPDGTRVLALEYGTDEQGLMQVVCRVLPLASGESVAVQLSPSATDFQWGPDSASLCYRDRADPAYNLYRVQLGGNDAPRKVTNFGEGRVGGYQWSEDGSRLLFIRRIGSVNSVWVTEADGTRPRKITNFTSEEVFQALWMADGKRIVVRAGNSSSDAVLIRDFQ